MTGTGTYVMKELKYFPDTSSYLQSQNSRFLKVRDLFEFQ